MSKYILKVILYHDDLHTKKIEGGPIRMIRIFRLLGVCVCVYFSLCVFFCGTILPL